MVFFIIIFLLFAFTLILNKSEEFNIEHIIKKGELVSKESFKGDVFYRGSVVDKSNSLYNTYIRLNDGKDIVVNNEEIYKAFNIGNVINITK